MARTQTMWRTAIDSVDGRAIMSNEMTHFVVWKSGTEMSIFNRKISLPLIVVFLATVIGALIGQFVWTVVAVTGVAVLVSVVQNLSGFHRAIGGRGRDVFPDTDAPSRRPSHSQNWLQQWDDEIRVRPSDPCPGGVLRRAAQHRFLGDKPVDYRFVAAG